MPRKPAKRKAPARKPATTSRSARPVGKKQRIPSGPTTSSLVLMQIQTVAPSTTAADRSG